MENRKDLIAQFGQQRILVVGDIMVDSYLIGRVSRISPEAPVPIVLLQEIQNRLGGAANVALNIASLGAEAVLCSVIGEDEDGEQIKMLMKNAQLDTFGLLSSKTRKTTNKSRVFSAGQQLLRIDSEDNHILSAMEEEQLFEKIIFLFNQQNFDVLLFQDYNKGVLTASLIKKLMNEAQNRQIKTIVDPKIDNFFAYKGATLFKPNLKEISEALGTTFEGTKQGLDSVVGKLREQLACEAILVTLSEKGMYLESEAGSFLTPTTTKSVSDVSGAGDTVISVVALCLAAKSSYEEMVALSNKAAGIVCSQLGVVPITKEELI